MEDYPANHLAADHSLDQLAAYNAQEPHNMYHSPQQYGSPVLGMSPYDYTYPDPSELNLHSYSSTPDTRSLSPYPSSLRTTRSGHHIGTSNTLGPRPAGVQKTSATKPKSKKKKKNQERTTPPTVTQPLSVLLAHLDPSKDKNIAEYVSRSVETRIAEAADSRDGRIKRPMNAFMLYRKGWQNRIKEMQSNENHQGVSKVAGDGWALEPEEVRNQFNAWSEIERDMHTQAFPGYKFKPQKTDKRRTVKSGYTSNGDESELDEADFGNRTIYIGNDDPVCEYQPPSSRVNTRSAYNNNNNNNNCHQSMKSSRSMSNSPFLQLSPYQQRAATPLRNNLSHYHYLNPGKPLPNPYPIPGQEQYYRQRVDAGRYQLAHSNAGYTVEPTPYDLENVYYNKTEKPPYHFSQSSPHQQDMMPHSPSPGPQQYEDYGRTYGHPSQRGRYPYGPNQTQVQISQHQQQQHYHQQPAFMSFENAAPYQSATVPPASMSTSSDINDNSTGLDTDYSAELWSTQSDLFGGHHDHAEDSAFALNFSDDLELALDPKLMPSNPDGSDWTTATLPGNILHQPDVYMNEASTQGINDVVASATAPVASSVPPATTSALTPTTASFVAEHTPLTPISTVVDSAGAVAVAETSILTPTSVTLAYTPAAAD